MKTLAALNVLLTVVNSLNSLAAQAAQISALIQKAQAEGRTEFSEDEWMTITGADDAARKLLVDVIAKALRS